MNIYESFLLAQDFKNVDPFKTQYYAMVFDEKNMSTPVVQAFDDYESAQAYTSSY